MAEYLSLISRAVDALETSTPEARRALYDRARGALNAQLRGLDPPLDESEITRERLALEDAIRTLESERASSDDVRGDSVRGNSDKADAAQPAASPSAPPSLTDTGLKGFRDTVAEAETLGTAAARASRSARDFADKVPRTAAPAAGPPASGSSVSASSFSTSSASKDTDAGQPTAAEAAADQLLPRHPQGDDGASPPDTDGGVVARPRLSRGALVSLIVILCALCVGALGYWQRDRVMSLASALKPSPARTVQTPPAATPERPKIEDRVGSESRPADDQSATAPSAAVAQKVVLYEEDPANPQGKRFVGSAIWKTETASPGPGLAPELVVRCDVEIPERRMRMTWSLRRNTDKALPASHTIEIMFTLPTDFPEGAIANTPGVLMKTDEQARGVPLAGLAVKVTNGYFLIGLSSAEVDRQRNIQLLKERSWFDLPIAYTNGKRAILAVEKGTPGERAFEDAFRAWDADRSSK